MLGLSLLMSPCLAIAQDAADDGDQPIECCCELTCYYKVPFVGTEEKSLQYSACFPASQLGAWGEFVCDSEYAEQLVCSRQALAEGSGIPFGYFYTRHDGACYTPCPVDSFLESDQARLQALRRFRDEVLSTSPAGTRLVALYYQYAGVLTTVFRDYPEIRQLAKEILDALTPRIQDLLAGTGAQALAVADLEAAAELLLDIIDAVFDTGIKEELVGLRHSARAQGIIE